LEEIKQRAYDALVKKRVKRKNKELGHKDWNGTGIVPKK